MERGFNCLRTETGLNWAFRMDGTPRGPMEFCPWIAGHGGNLSSVNAKGGGRHTAAHAGLVEEIPNGQDSVEVSLTAYVVSWRIHGDQDAFNGVLFSACNTP